MKPDQEQQSESIFDENLPERFYTPEQIINLAKLYRDSGFRIRATLESAVDSNRNNKGYIPEFSGESGVVWICEFLGRIDKIKCGHNDPFWFSSHTGDPSLGARIKGLLWQTQKCTLWLPFLADYCYNPFGDYETIELEAVQDAPGHISYTWFLRNSRGVSKNISGKELWEILETLFFQIAKRLD